MFPLPTHQPNFNNIEINQVEFSITPIIHTIIILIILFSVLSILYNKFKGVLK